MSGLDQREVREEIARLELRLEELSSSLEQSRKAILFSKLSLAVGILLTVAIVFGLMRAQPLPVVLAIAAVFGGIVGFGSNVSTLRQDTSALEAAATARAELINQLELRDIVQTTNLSFYQ